LIPFVLIYISQGSYAFDNSSDLQSGSSARDFSSISDLFPKPEDMACVPKCDGHQGCGQFKDVDSCIDDGAELGCFWVCQ
jgi:hypothetical protein